MPNIKFKNIFSLRIMLELKRRGFEPVAEKTNIYKPELIVWVYEETPDFSQALNDILGVEYYG